MDQTVDDQHLQRREAGIGVLTDARFPPAAPITETAGHHVADDRLYGAGEERGANPELGAADAVPLAPLIALIMRRQRERRFCIVSQSRCDRSCESFIAASLGFRTDMPEKERKALWNKVSAFRKDVEKAGGGGQMQHDDQLVAALSACVPIVLDSAIARRVWDKRRKEVEAEMRRLARQLPVYAWAKDVTGFGDLGLAIIIGETNDLSNYATKERVWKRLGLAVIDGECQQRKSGTEAAAAHGFNPKRRAEVWAVVDSFFRHQWAGEKDGVPAHPKTVYWAVYGRRKARTADREDWTPKRRDNDARRIMGKFLIENLHRVWNGKPPLQGPGVESAEG